MDITQLINLDKEMYRYIMCYRGVLDDVAMRIITAIKIIHNKIRVAHEMYKRGGNEEYHICGLIVKFKENSSTDINLNKDEEKYLNDIKITLVTPDWTVITLLSKILKYNNVHMTMESETIINELINNYYTGYISASGGNQDFDYIEAFGYYDNLVELKQNIHNKITQMKERDSIYLDSEEYNSHLEEYNSHLDSLKEICRIQNNNVNDTSDVESE